MSLITYTNNASRRLNHSGGGVSFRDYNAVDLNGKDVPFPVSRDIPATHLVPRSMLVCLMIYSGNTNEALRQLSYAYKYHMQLGTGAHRSPVPRADFLQFILNARE